MGRENAALIGGPRRGLPPVINFLSGGMLSSAMTDSIRLGALFAALGLGACVGPPCGPERCIGSEPDESMLSIPLRGLDEARGCWGHVGYLNVPYDHVRTLPTADRLGCLFDAETGRAYHTPYSYDLDWDALGYRPCGVGAGWGDGSEAPPLSRCDDP